MPITARSEFLNLTRPGSGATNILFTGVNRPLVLPFALSHGVPGVVGAHGHDEGAAVRTGLVAAPALRGAESTWIRQGNHWEYPWLNSTPDH
ncbi:hypothetical protein GCM10018791_22850 [Streptomyces zaomyceticus]|nr:hypothetical protein GCM10018791_22850 [Streptomyces zaomyceticus]